jgi:RNA polymerase sigma factor (TIGR02999 family)
VVRPHQRGDMSTPSSHQVTQLLLAWGSGDAAAFNELMPLVYAELRTLARRQMQRERSGHTLQATALVHEAYLRLIDQRQVHWQNRAQFFAVAAQVMRRVVVDYARKRRRIKRGGGTPHLSLDEAALLTPSQSPQVLELDEALYRLAAVDERKSRVVEMRYFGGLSVEEVAAVLGVSENTVISDWAVAKAWLRRELESQSENAG